MKFWTLSRKMSYEEHKKAEEDAVIKVMGEVIAAPQVTWWKDIITTADFNEILKVLEENHDKISQFRIGEVDVPDEETLKKQNKNTNRCIDCGHYDAHWLYTDDMRSISPLSLGSCEKCRRNFVSIDPYNQVPSWCPLKGEKE